MNKFWLTTLGCKINQYESESIRQSWIKKGMQPAEKEEDADIVVVNSCAVTAAALRDLRQTVRHINRYNPEGKIIVTGCAAQVFAAELAELPGVVEVIPQERKAELLCGPLEREGACCSENVFAPFSIDDYQRARAVVKVQDGCSHRCTYCIVPITRGKSISRPIEDILKEIKRLLDAGFREMIISGINLSHYGRDIDDRPDFWDLMEEIEQNFGAEWKGRARLRISSLEPGQLHERALEIFKKSSLICPQLHLSLQSGDAEVLKRMGRGHYKPEDVLDFLESLKTIWPVFGLGADILTGFPGETEQEFQNTLEFCHKLPLSYAHVFPYSLRPGTAAAKMPGHLPDKIKKARAAQLREVVKNKKSKFIKELTSLNSLHVLVQDGEVGVCEYYTTCKIVECTQNPESRSLVKVKPLGIEGDKILAACV
ncbi:tRNA (N(6)-L-threonylcarbamoyladenosine(37)-C(2))-methylthiotransferase MtaB [Maridesulfovibrio bastinii]|uniref:tRNA (N(6)-L-threonylcarbamoyladenosine(37)-C(2))- methylthiotransferase MtaB n=1 Tax=Maridesulfovibrio bastinii TaxID=47157 RepID=UPI000415D415|nr:tRNA (N(6)-L-threonylcarbamoyladenosine(37)-C(2))-methylthiotransferase MtaB [Maridesulfovibrio bastinii]